MSRFPADAPDLSRPHEDAAEILDDALDAARDEAEPVRALRAAARSYSEDAVVLRSLGEGDWSFFYDTVARELAKIADGLGRP